MSLFENVIGAKTNFVRTDKNNVLTGENTFNGIVNLNGNVNGLDINDINNLQTVLDTKATQFDLALEISDRVTGQQALQNDINDEIQNRTLSDNALAGQIVLKANQTALNTEITNRTNADTALQLELNTKASSQVVSLEIENRIIADTQERTQRIESDLILQEQINLKLAESNSIHRNNYAFYCVDGRNDLHSVLTNVNNQGAYISISSGSFGNTTPLTIDKDNLSMFSVPSTPPICEFACPLTIASTANRIRTRYMSFDGVCNLNGKRCVYTHSTFNDNVNIGAGTTEYMTFANCEFSAGKTITFSATMASVVYIIECNIAGASLVFNNASPLQVIFSNCSGFVSLPTTAQATLIGLNVLANGSVVQQNISKIVLPSGEGTNNQVLTSTGSGNCIWTTPSGGGGSSDIIKERFSRYTLGQTISTSRGNITLPNITTELQHTGTNLTWIELTGSNIDYTPPVNSSVVEYELTFYAYSVGYPDSGIGLQFYINNVAQPITRAKQTMLDAGTSTYGQMRYTFKTIIEINGINDPNKCFVDNWNTSKNLKLRVTKLRSETMSFHRVAVLLTDNPVQNTDTIIAPLLTITAY